MVLPFLRSQIINTNILNNTANKLETTQSRCTIHLRSTNSNYYDCFKLLLDLNEWNRKLRLGEK